MPKIPKGKLVIYVSAETEASLREYQRVHSKRFATIGCGAKDWYRVMPNGCQPIAEPVRVTFAID